MLLYFYAPFVWKRSQKMAKENPLSLSLSFYVGIVRFDVGAVGLRCLWSNDKLSTHFSFIFNTFDWYIEHLAHNLSNSLWLKWLFLCTLYSELCSVLCYLYSALSGCLFDGSSHQLAGIVSISSGCQASATRHEARDGARRDHAGLRWSPSMSNAVWQRWKLCCSFSHCCISKWLIFFKSKCVLHFLIGWIAFSCQVATADSNKRPKTRPPNTLHSYTL